MTRDEMRDKLTDYAVGELTPAERTEIERALEADAELRAELDAIRETVALVSACPAGSVQTEEKRLDPERVDEILSRIVTTPSSRKRWWIPIATMAASALVGLGFWTAISAHNAREARRERDTISAKYTKILNALESAAARNRHEDPHEGDLLAGGYPPTVTVPQGEWTEATVLALIGNTSSGWAAPAETGYDPGLLGEAGLFTREHFDSPGFYDLRSGGVYPVKKLEELRKLQKQVIAGKRVDLGNKEGLLKGIEFKEYGAAGYTEEYNPLVDNPFLRPFDSPLSTFSIDVDTAAYANMRRFLNDGQLPPPDAVRLEELVNYFHYAYTPPAGVEPFSVALEAHAAPWEPKHQLVRIGLQGKEIEIKDAPAANLVFLVDVSGSMNEPDKLPLVQASLTMLTGTLREQDKVGMVVYAGNAGVVLPPTAGSRKEEIASAIQRLQAGGSTNGGQGIEMAYKLAADNFVKDGVNRVILCTDGDFNVGTTSEGDLDRLIEEKRKTGVFLSVLGFGTGNYADARMQSLADKGNGNASYIDTIKEARKVLVEQATGTLITIAKDVKIQVEFNPSKVAAYRLIGYENRLLAAQDFNDDKKDAGEIGAGHQVTALYEVIPAGQDVPAAGVDELKYQKPATATAEGAAAGELCTVKLRYKAPDGDTSKKIEFSLADPGLNAAGASTDFEFAASVAAFAMCLRDSEYKGQANFGLVKELAMAGLGDDAKGYRKEFVELVKKAGELAEEKK